MEYLGDIVHELRKLGRCVNAYCYTFLGLNLLEYEILFLQNHQIFHLQDSLRRPHQHEEFIQYNI